MNDDNMAGFCFWVVQTSMVLGKLFGLIDLNWWQTLSPLLVVVGLTLVVASIGFFGFKR